MDPLKNPDAPQQEPPGAPAADEARQEKIARIKKAVEDGTYHVSSDKVARKLIEHMLKPHTDTKT